MRDNEQNNSRATGSLRLHLVHRNRGRNDFVVEIVYRVQRLCLFNALL